MNIESLLNELQCTICLNLFSFPLVTACGHTFCRDCITQYVNVAKVQNCPLCKHRFKISTLPLNVSLDKIIRMLPQEQPTIDFSVETKRKSETQYFYVCTSLLPEKMKDLFQVFCKLFKVRINQDFNERVTHLIAGPVSETKPQLASRTTKYLQAIAMGRWVLSYEWISDSIAKEYIISEEEYEVSGDQFCCLNTPRISRIKGGMGQLLSQFQFLIDDSNTQVIKAEVIETIIKHCGGTVVKYGKKSNLTITIKIENDPKINMKWQEVNPIIVNQRWLFDTISHFKVQNFYSYLTK